jgi:hypothetical protein
MIGTPEQQSRAPVTFKMKEHIHPDPPWLRLLHAIHLEWRDSEIEKGNDPDSDIEHWLREQGKWPLSKKPSH